MILQHPDYYLFSILISEIINKYYKIHKYVYALIDLDVFFIIFFVCSLKIRRLHSHRSNEKQ